MIGRGQQPQEQRGEKDTAVMKGEMGKNWVRKTSLWREEEGQTAGVGGRGITQDDREGHRGLCLLRILSPS